MTSCYPNGNWLIDSRKIDIICRNDKSPAFLSPLPGKCLSGGLDMWGCLWLWVTGKRRWLGISQRTHCGSHWMLIIRQVVVLVFRTAFASSDVSVSGILYVPQFWESVYNIEHPLSLTLTQTHRHTHLSSFFFLSYSMKWLYSLTYNHFKKTLEGVCVCTCVYNRGEASKMRF